MNYYQPREIVEDGQPTGKWKYTMFNKREGTFAVGYCADCSGHDTKEGAYQHYKDYLLDKARFDNQQEDQMNRCQICQAFTQRLASVPNHRLFVLCEAHCNREGLSQVLVVGDQISSF